MIIRTTIETDDGLAATLVRQRAAFLRDGPPPLTQRRSDLIRLKNALRAYREDFVAAINTDFGHRSRQETSLFDLASVVEGINFLHHNLRRWLRPERRRVALPFRPASNRVLYQPLGVIGHYIALELSCCAGSHAARDGFGSRQSRHDQAIRADTANISLDEIGPG